MIMSELSVLTSWMRVPALESVPVAGASQKAPHRVMVPKLGELVSYTSHRFWKHFNLLIRVDESVSVLFSASTVEVERRDVVSGNVSEVRQGGRVTGCGVGTEPCSVTGGRGGVRREVTG